MDWRKLRTNAGELFQKYKYVLLIIVLGIVLMTLPGKSSDESDKNKPVSLESVVDPEEKLKSILQQVRGAGRVDVLLTVASGEEIIYQSDTNHSFDQNGQTENSDTVIVTGVDRAQTGLVSRINSPKYLGAVVVCDGAENPTVRLQIVEAVSKATGLGSDKISILKMK